MLFRSACCSEVLSLSLLCVIATQRGSPAGLIDSTVILACWTSALHLVVVGPGAPLCISLAQLEAVMQIVSELPHCRVAALQQGRQICCLKRPPSAVS